MLLYKKYTDIADTTIDIFLFKPIVFIITVVIKTLIFLMERIDKLIKNYRNLDNK